MEKQILKQLDAIEQQYNITILHACETGSRAWGFASPDSDYDVRFIYMHKLDWYFSIDDKKDTIEQMHGELDLVGWDIRKSLRLFRKSNAAMFERIQSPIVYKQEVEFAELLKHLSPDYFSCRAGLHHYLSMAFKYYLTCTVQKEVKLKAYFYLLRTALASLWIIERRTVPPLEFYKLLILVEEQKIREKILDLIALKAQITEAYLHPREKELEAFVKDIISYCKAREEELSKQQGPTEALDHLFRETTKAVWHLQ